MLQLVRPRIEGGRFRYLTNRLLSLFHFLMHGWHWTASASFTICPVKVVPNCLNPVVCEAAVFKLLPNARDSGTTPLLGGPGTLERLVCFILDGLPALRQSVHEVLQVPDPLLKFP